MDGVRAYKMAQLSELRLVVQEVGSLSDARSMPTEVRKWWCDQIVEKNKNRGAEPPPENGGKRFITKDVK